MMELLLFLFVAGVVAALRFRLRERSATAAKAAICNTLVAHGTDRLFNGQLARPQYRQRWNRAARRREKHLQRKRA